MLDWLTGWFTNFASTVGDPIVGMVHWAVHALASVVLSVFRNVLKAWDDFTGAIDGLGDSIWHFVNRVWHALWWLITKEVPRIWRWLAQESARVWKGIRYAWATAVRLFNDAIGFAERIVDDVIGWVQRDVWKPLRDLADLLWRDLLKWGWTAWWWITHPADLAKMLLAYLIKAAEDAFWSVATPAGTFALRLVLANARRFAILIEDIVRAVL